jgi:hypothetical protein
MPLAGFGPTIPVFKWAKTFHALDRAATVTGSIRIGPPLTRGPSSVPEIFNYFSSPVTLQRTSNGKDELEAASTKMTAIFHLFVIYLMTLSVT